MTLTDTPRISVTTSIELVDAETAKEWLARNTRNRPLRRGLVATYASDMRNNRWRFTGDPVKFADDGSLLDGQHRLQAVVQADATVEMLVVRELDTGSQAVMDTGAKRTAGDALTLDGERNARTLAAVALMIATGGGSQRRQVSTSEIMAVAAADPSIASACEAAASIRIPSITPSVLAYTYWRLSSVDGADAAMFFEALSSLVGLPTGSPILALHRRLNGFQGDKRARSHVYRQETIACIFMAWNAWRRGENRSLIKLAYNAAGQLSVPDPK